MELKPLSPTEYLRTFGAADNEGEWAGVDTSHSHPFGALTAAGQRRGKLRQIQGGLLQGYEDYIKKFNQQHVKQMFAPKDYQEASGVVPGLEKLAPRKQESMRASEAIPTIGGYRDDELLPGHLDPYRYDVRTTMGFTNEPVGTPIVERMPHPNPSQLIPIDGGPNLHAPLSPAHLELYDRLTSVPSTVDPETGALVPIALAKPKPGLMSPDDIIAGSQFRETMGLAPEGTTESLRKAPPTRPLPSTQVGQALDDVTKKFVDAAKDRTAKQEFRELEDEDTGAKSVYLVDKTTGEKVKKIGKAPRSVNDLLGLDRTREVLVRMGHDPYETALRATRGDQHATAIVEEARQLAKQEEIEIKSSGERAQIEARPLDPVDRNAIVMVNEFKRNIANIEKIPEKKLKEYVGYFSLPSHQLIQIARQDNDFAQFMTSIGFLQRDFFSDETAGSALTKAEIGILRMSIPTGNEWGAYTDFKAKLNDAKERADSIIDGRTQLSTETRGQSRDRLTGKKSSAASRDIDAKLDKLIEELRKSK